HDSHILQKASFTGLIAVKLVVCEFPGLRAAPSLCCDWFKWLGPAAATARVAVRMQAGVKVSERAPSPNKFRFRQRVRFAPEREGQMLLGCFARGRSVKLRLHAARLPGI